MWVARDKNGDLYLYQDKPIRIEAIFGSQYLYFGIPNILFPELKWEDDPIEIEIIKAEAVRR